MNIMGNLPGRASRLGDAVPAATQLRSQSEKLRVASSGAERVVATCRQAEAATPPARIANTASVGVVRLFHTVETVHDRLALCRIAPAMEETLATVDGLRVASE